MMKNAFYFILIALFSLQIFEFLSQLFGDIEKTDLLERLGWLHNFLRHNLVSKLLNTHFAQYLTK